MIQLRLIITGLILSLLMAAPSLRAETSLTVLAEIGPWPVVSRLIGFRDRLWFANSVKGRNHNSADIYSLHPDEGGARYERHLFSQDAGRPAIADGLLYWPFEDARFSLGYGHFMATDGHRWQEGVIPTGRIFHTHAMAVTDRLIAATSAWRAHLDLSLDGGRTWQQVYDHPTPERRVSRIVDLATLGSNVFGVLTSRDQRGLMQLDGTSVEPVPGWPSGNAITALTTFQGHIYALVRSAKGTAIWRTDGERSKQIVSLRDVLSEGAEDVARDLIADERGLWLLTTRDAGGRIWQSQDGRDWNTRFTFRGGRAFELASYQGRMFAGGTDPERGIGMLWGSSEQQAALDPEPIRASNFDLFAKATTGSLDWTAAGRELETLLGDSSTYRNRARKLRDRVRSLLAENPPPGFFAQRLTSPMPDEPMSLIGGAVQIPSALMGRALLLWAMALQGKEATHQIAKVPLSLLQEPWTRSPNRPEKYFDTQPFALWAIAGVKQNDLATIDALIGRLDRSDDPLWLKGDIIGALTALTDQRHAYDIAAWKRWWFSARPHWTSR